MEKARTQTPTAAGTQLVSHVTNCSLGQNRPPPPPPSLTCEEFLANFTSVHERSEDALDGAEHAAQTQVHQHEEEHDGPEGRGGWEMGHGLREGDEGQAGALDHLESRRNPA